MNFWCMIDMCADGDRVLQSFQSRGMAGICLCYAPLELARWPRNSTPLYILIVAISFHHPSCSENS